MQRQAGSASQKENAPLSENALTRCRQIDWNHEANYLTESPDEFSGQRIAPKVLLPGRGLKERLKHTLRQK
jgi:hypothetical protein